MTIELSEKETNLILRGLGELPAKDSIELILRINKLWNEVCRDGETPSV